MESKKIKALITEEKEESYAAENTSEKKERFVICIGREFGSGGKYIGEELAKRFHIKCYDKELLENLSKNYNIDIETLEKLDEKEKSSFWYGFATNYVFTDDDEISPISASDSVFLKQAKGIEELYENANCVIIGRCSDYILKKKKNAIKIFVYASDMEFKIRRKMKYENMNYEEAKKKIEKTDKERAEYYNHFTNQKWGEKSNYDISIDTSILGIEKTIDILEAYIKERTK